MKKSDKKKTNPFLFVGVGCLVIVIVLSAAAFFAGRFFARQLSSIKKGNVSFTDTKTGTKVDIGGTKVPDNFPKDFPLYSGAKVTSALSGAQAGKANGFWLTMATPDSVETVSAFYTRQLESSGWKSQQTFTVGDTTTGTIAKGEWGGTLAITKNTTTKETNIVIILGSDK